MYVITAFPQALHHITELDPFTVAPHVVIILPKSNGIVAIAVNLPSEACELIILEITFNN